MPATALERGGRRQDSQRKIREWIIRDATTEAEAKTAVLAVAPATVDGVPRIDAETTVEELPDSVFESGGGSIWLGTVFYGHPGFEFGEPESFEITFDIATESVHITHSKETVASYGTNPPDFKGAINVQSDGTIEGCDIGVAHLGYEVVKVFEESFVDQAYVLTLASIVGTVNVATFHGFPAGELMLVRVYGRKRPDRNWSIAFGMFQSPNATNIPVGDITVTAKNGWDYLWVRYAFASDSGSQTLVKIPVAAYVERVFDYTDYDDIGI